MAMVFSFTCDDPPIHDLSIITLIQVCLHGRQILTFSQDYYKAVTYMCSYLSKQEDECSRTVKQALKKSLEKDSRSYEQMRSVAHAYSSECECSLQEVVYQVLPELQLRKLFPGVLYANSDPGKPRVLLLALTGIAAININGNTINSGLHISCL